MLWSLRDRLAWLATAFILRSHFQVQPGGLWPAQPCESAPPQHPYSAFATSQ